LYNTKKFVKTQMQNRLPVTSYLFSVFRFLAVKKLLVYIIAVLAATKEWDYCSNKTLADIRGLTLSPKKLSLPCL